MNSFVGKMNQDLSGNRKLFWKEMSKANGEKVDSCRRIKCGNWRLALCGFDGGKPIRTD